MEKLKREQNIISFRSQSKGLKPESKNPANQAREEALKRVLRRADKLNW